MAQKIDEAKYESMISALNSYASRIGSSIAEMQSIATMCLQALGDEDAAVEKICKGIKDSKEKYEQVIEKAGKIASTMQEELDEQRRENQVWAEED